MYRHRHVIFHLIFAARWQMYEEGLTGLRLVPINTELIDEIWTEDREERPNEPLMIHQLEFAGIARAVQV